MCCPFSRTKQKAGWKPVFCLVLSKRLEPSRLAREAGVRVEVRGAIIAFSNYMPNPISACFEKIKRNRREAI